MQVARDGQRAKSSNPIAFRLKISAIIPGDKTSLKLPTYVYETWVSYAILCEIRQSPLWVIIVESWRVSNVDC